MELTINQIIILLDIFRGTETQKEIGTNFSDCMKLYNLKLVENDDSNGKFKVTKKGFALVSKIKSIKLS